MLCSLSQDTPLMVDNPRFHLNTLMLGLVRNMKFHHADSDGPHRGAGALAALLLSLLLLLLPVVFPSLFSPLGQSYSSIFSEWIAPKTKHSHLLEGALQRFTSEKEQTDLWTPLENQGWNPCEFLTVLHRRPEPQGFIKVFLDGGLNQQRMGICDAVAVAKILNATLVIPHLEVNSVWRDTSSFTDIFDVDHFISILSDDVSIVEDVPPEFQWSTRRYYATGIRPTRVKSAPLHASPAWYIDNVLPVLHRHGVAAISPFSHRLGFDDVPADVQRLRCKTNFIALVFVPHVRQLGDFLIRRMTDDRPGKFAALHLRFDKDMAAHSACDFGGGRAEARALAKYRQQIWQGRVDNSKLTDDELRSRGRCPLSPEEAGLLLAALGFANTTRLYLASHNVYGGEMRISALRDVFPMMEDKYSLASVDELANVRGKASLLAAVDYHVCLKSDVFVPASPGNMHNALVGHRTYLGVKTIRPNMRLLGQAFLDGGTWEAFRDSATVGHRNQHERVRLRKPNQSIYTYPAPHCMCARTRDSPNTT